MSKKSLSTRRLSFETPKSFQKLLISMARDTLLGFPSHPFLTVITNIPLYRQSPDTPYGRAIQGCLLLFFKLALQPQLHLNMGNAVLRNSPDVCVNPYFSYSERVIDLRLDGNGVGVQLGFGRLDVRLRSFSFAPFHLKGIRHSKDQPPPDKTGCIRAGSGWLVCPSATVLLVPW